MYTIVPLLFSIGEEVIIKDCLHVLNLVLNECEVVSSDQQVWLSVTVVQTNKTV